MMMDRRILYLNLFRLYLSMLLYRYYEYNYFMDNFRYRQGPKSQLLLFLFGGRAYILKFPCSKKIYTSKYLCNIVMSVFINIIFIVNLN